MARILVVDDDPDILRIVERVLKMSKHDVYTAYDAMKAMDLLNVSNYDMLISDGNMPRFSGFELVRTLKNNKRFTNMAIAMLTGLREKKDIDKAIRAGVDDYIIKPIDPALLVQKVESLFIKKPPTVQVEYEFPETANYTKAQIGLPCRLTKVTESEMTVRLHTEVPEGLTVELDTDFFKKLEAKAPSLKILSCRKILEFDYEVKIAFVGIGDTFQQKIRNWILSQAPTKKKSAS